ncbi:MAG: hypothetical protein WBX15_09905 [Thermoanaerobaculia bacterium]
MFATEKLPDSGFPRRSTMRRTILIIALLAVIAGDFDLFYLQPLFRDRRPFAAMLTALPFRRMPGFVSFMASVRTRTRETDRIAIAPTAPRWESGYDYVIWRANYLLAPRQLVPLLDYRNELAWSNLKYADYLITWRRRPPPGFVAVTSLEDWTLWRWGE